MWGGEDWRGDSGGGLEVCEGDGSVAGEGRRREGAFEGGEEGGGAGVRIAACKFLACPAAGAFANPQTTWSLSPSCESISLGVFVLPAASVCRLLCVSVCPLGRRRSVHPQQVMPASVSVCLKGRPALGGLCPCWVDLTERKMMKRWKKDAWTD